MLNWVGEMVYVAERNSKHRLRPSDMKLIYDLNMAKIKIGTCKTSLMKEG
jgi:hypothetical protein